MTEGPIFFPPLPHAQLLPFEGERRSIADYERHGGYEMLRRALGLTGEEIIQQLVTSNVRGRGGAGFPAGRKASFLAAKQPRYLVVNADESEPGTFKDREIILRNPHLLLEGMLIMCWAVRAAQAFIYIRGEYATEAEILEQAVQEARGRGLIGHLLPHTDYAVEFVVHRGAGAYICGEETALLSSLNGQRGQPWAKPPFPAVAGAFHDPTLLNNVETLANVPVVLAMGGEEYARVGTQQSTGTRMYSLSGHVERPGNFELVPTTTFRELIYEHGGGVRGGRTLKAFVPGGSSAPVLLPDQLDVPMTYEDVAKAGSMTGSGAVIVVDDRTCMVQFSLRTAQFYRHESCGKCSPCREGTRWLTELVGRVEAGHARSDEIDLILDVCDRIEGKCLCALGDACAMPVRSHVLRFRDEFEAHVRHGGCPYHDHSPLSDLYPAPSLSRSLPLVTAG